MIILLLSSFGIKTQAEEAEKFKDWTIGLSGEVIPGGELAQSYDFLGELILQYSFKKKESSHYFADFALTNSFQDGSSYSQFKAGLGYRYHYGRIGNFSFFVDGSLGLTYSREVFNIQLANRESESTFDEFGVLGKVSTGFFFNETFGFSIFIKQNHDQATSTGLNLLFSF